MITEDQIAREKDRLPRGWGRFGKALDHLAEVSEPNETLLASCVTINPTFEHTGIGLLGMTELSESTNTLVAATDRRVIVLATGITGAPRKHIDFPYEGLQIINPGKKEVTLGWPDARLRFRGAAKQMLPELLETLTARARPAPASAPGVDA
jgi:hypothetical protein